MDDKQGSEPVVAISHRTLRRIAVPMIVVLALVGVGIGAYAAGQSSGPNGSSTPTSAAGSTTTDCQGFHIHSTSMSPTLKTGDSIDACQLRGAPKVGQIVVYHPSPFEVCDPDVSQSGGLANRVIGFPGQTIQGRDGAVYINGKRLAEPWLPAATRESSPVTKSFGPLVVPREHYFMMGDNRTDSCDNGSVPESYVVGAVIDIYSVHQIPQPTTTTEAPTRTTQPLPTPEVSNCGRGPEREPASLYWCTSAGRHGDRTRLLGLEHS